ncbi:MAG: adenylate/guanylate cyclase domain-containing response regulator [Gammaproteobacteria bacterium]|nr:MAG: adenylate/guanylate cyclase domain-containing response regulator [Gammaproteobacteria bacterium]
MQPQKPVILYVDDEQSNLDAFAAAFRRYYTIFTAISATEAIKVLEKHDIELIITDQRMPDITGVQFLEAVIPKHSKSVRMILTGFSDINAIIKSINNGLVLRYITKPWEEDELKQIIDIGIKIYRQEQSNYVLLNELKEIIDKQEKTIDLFQKYVPKDIIDQIMNDSTDTSSLLAENRVISVLFVDIHHFTTISETIDPKILVDYLNKYFSVMVDIVIKNHGNIYKILGDGLIATFGAPTSSLDDKRNAALCALEMVAAIKDFNDAMKEKVNFDTSIGISITTGEAIVGHTISENFLSYSVIGEVVENALKIEGLTHDMPNTVLIDESTFQFIKDDFQIEKADSVTVGEKTIQLYKLISVKG